MLNKIYFFPAIPAGIYPSDLEYIVETPFVELGPESSLSTPDSVKTAMALFLEESSLVGASSASSPVEFPVEIADFFFTQLEK